MKRLLLSLTFAGSILAAQSLTVSVLPVQIWPGQSITATVTFTDSNPSAGIAGFAGTFSLAPAGLTLGTITAGSATTAASKVITVNGNEWIDIGDGSTLNDSIVSSGVLLTVPIPIPTGTKPGAGTISITSPLASSGAGGPVTITATSGTFNICSVYAVTGDCTAAAADVIAMLKAFLGESSCTGQLANVGSGTCKLTDVELEIEAALGKIS